MLLHIQTIHSQEYERKKVHTHTNKIHTRLYNNMGRVINVKNINVESLTGAQCRHVLEGGH